MLSVPGEAIVASGGLEEFESPVKAYRATRVLSDGHRRESTRDVEVLLEDLSRIDVADEGSGWQTQPKITCSRINVYLDCPT